MYTSLYDYLVKNGVAPPTAQSAVERIGRSVRSRAPLSRNAARLVKAVRKAFFAVEPGRDVPLFEPGKASVDQAVVLPGIRVTKDEETPIQLRPPPFDRTFKQELAHGYHNPNLLAHNYHDSNRLAHSYHDPNRLAHNYESLPAHNYESLPGDRWSILPRGEIQALAQQVAGGM